MKSMTNLSVSVVMATFNGAAYIEQQLHSILDQLGDNDEVILVDDHSVDATLELVDRIGDARIHVYRNVANMGVQRSFEKAINLALGDIIFLSDQDDVWLDGKIDRIKRELEAYDLVVTDCKVVDEQLNLLHQSLFELIKPRTGIFRNLMRNSYTGCCMAFNRRVLDAALPLPNNLPMHDWWLGLVAEVVGSVKFIDEPFLLYRRHGANISTLSTPSTLSLWKKISMRLFLLKSLFYRFVLKV